MSARDLEICRLYGAGMTGPEIGRRFGITRNRVAQIVSKAGIKRPGRANYAYLSNSDASRLMIDTARRALAAEIEAGRMEIAAGLAARRLATL